MWTGRREAGIFRRAVRWPYPQYLETMQKPALALIAALSVPVSARGQDFDFYANGPYKPEVPRPAELLGYEPGEFHTEYGKMLRVMESIVEAVPDRARSFTYGLSVEGRPLILVVISDPRNMERLDDVKASIRRLRDPRRTRGTEAAAIARATPAIAWMNYANDGNESAAFEAAIQVAYQLAAGEDSLSRAIRKDVVTVINPGHNPESHERFVAWYNSFAVADTTHAALEHDAPWGMSTNNNHYQIDLNRDALGITQRETRALVEAHHEWSPQVFVDHHGQTTHYFMPPPVLPINPSLPKNQIIAWTEIYGRGNAEAFDRHGWNYYVRDVFDLHYPGYWDSWPALNGAIGMTYETDGGGSRGYAWIRDDGTILTFRDGIAKHFTASLATLGTTAEHRERRLLDYYEFFRSGMDDLVESRPWKRFVIVPGADPERAARLVEILLRDDIEVHVSTEPFRADGAHDYLSGAVGRRDLPAGAYLIDLRQPQARLVDALLAPDAELDPEFVERQLAKRELNARRGAKAARERYEFYDITAWSLPLSFGVEGYWLEEAGDVAVRRLTLEREERPLPWRPPAYTGTRDLEELPESLRTGIDGGVSGGPARTAYVFRYERNASARLLIALLKEGYRVAVATAPMSAGGISYPRGSLVVRVARNPEELHRRIGVLGRRFGVPVDAVNTAYYEEGPTGVGSNPVVALRFPRVAVLAGEPVSTRAYGHVWYTLEREFGLPFTALRPEPLVRSLAEFDVIVLPSGRPGGFRAAFRDEDLTDLREWVRAGGVLVALAGAAEFLTDPDWELTSARLLGDEEDEGASREGEGSAEPESVGEPGYPPLVSPGAGESGPLSVPGAIVRASLDLTHPFTFGYESENIAVLVSGDDMYRPSKEGSNPVALLGPDLVLSGFGWPGNTQENLSGTAWLVDEPLGSGRVILFADDPNFRLIWPSLSRLFLNTILIAPTVR